MKTANGTPVRKRKLTAVDINKIVSSSTNPLARAQPRGDRVLVRRDQPQKQTAGGIILAESTLERKHTGVVIRVGPGRILENGQRQTIDDLEPGQPVLLTGFAGVEMRNHIDVSDADEFVMLREEDIIANLE